MNREDVHRLVDAVPEARLPVLEKLLRGGLADQTGLTAPRHFTCLGTLPGEHDLAERSEDILREGRSARSSPATAQR